MLAFLTGLVAGTGHVISGPDHWAAVAPISASRPEGAIRFGFRWGLGHGIGVLVMGLIGIGLKDAISLDGISNIAEIFVGGTLLFTGVWALVKSRSLVVHKHPHEHEEHQHEHYHVHTGLSTAEHERSHLRHEHAASGIGLLHGVAGSGHVWGLLPSLALPVADAVLYLTAFVGSSILSMSLFSHCIGLFLRNKGSLVMRRSLRVTGLLSMLVGGYWFFHSIA
ncbi:MAG: hydantoin utilization protein A [Myxococcota bacterium]|nr:hydantoin utilization protein A [Myxococcota bacterium]